MDRPLLAVSYTQTVQLTASDSTSGASFGNTLAIQGDVAVVGAPFASIGNSKGQGAVYIYYRDQGGPDKWGLVKKLVASNGESGDHFGCSVAISGDTIVVGAKDATKINTNLAKAGTVYVFRRNIPAADAWGQTQIVNAKDAQKSDRFGTSVTINGNIMMAGAPFEDPGVSNAGSAYVFVRTAEDAPFTEVGKLSAAQNNDKYGNAMAMDATTLVVGAPNSTVSGKTWQGLAYVYAYWKDAYGVYQFSKIATLTSSPGAAYDYFGTSVALSNNVLAVGAPNSSTYAAGGAAYLYTRDSSGVWGLVKRETATPGTAGNLFGNSVAIDGDLLAVGAPGEDANGKTDSGAIYMFARNQDTPNSWSQSGPVTLTAGSASDAFGTTTGLSGATLLGGTPNKTVTTTGQGAVYVMKMNFPIEIDLNGPIASSIDYYTAYTEDTPAVHITDPTAMVSSNTSSPMDKMVVTIDNLRNPGFETLSAGTAAGITAGDISYDATTGTLTIDPPGTVALSSFNTVLRSVTYRNTAQNPDPIQRIVRFWVSDGVNSNLQQPGGYVTIQPVNDPPAITAQTPFVTDEEVNYDFNGGLALTDPDSGINFIQVTLGVNRGDLTLGSTTGLTITSGDGSADASLTFTAALVDANAALQHLLYTPAANDTGSASLALTINDLGNTGSGGALNASGTYPITINPVNDGPILTVPGPQTTTEDTPLTFSGAVISVADIDSGTSPLRVTLSPTNGAVTLNPGSWVTEIQTTPNLIFTGTAAQVNAALNGLVYTPAANFSGTTTLEITLDDQGATGMPGPLSATQTIPIEVMPINDAPTLGLPGPLSAVEDTPVSLGLISVGDVDAGGDPIQMTLTANHGKLSPIDARTLTLTQPLDELSSALANLSFVPDPDYFGAASVDFTISDNGSRGSGGAKTTSGAIVINIAGVNDGPRMSLPGAQTVNQDSRLILSGPINITDVDANQVQITLSVEHGALTLPVVSGLTFTVPSDGTDDSAMTFTGTPTALNTALAQIVYTPALDYAGPDTLSAAVDDLGSTGSGGPLGDSGSVSINVVFVDNAPEVSAPVSLTTDEGSPLIFGSAIVVSSPDPNSSSFRLTLAVAHGSLTSGIASGAAFSFSGSLTEINALLSGLIYTPDSEFFGGDDLVITVIDPSHANAQTTAEIVLTVQPVNDGPSMILPPAQTAVEDTPLALSTENGSAIQVTDIDSGANPVETTLQAAHGTLTLASTANLISITGNGTSEIIFQGSLAELNAAMDGLVFQPDANYNGPASLAVTVNDLGNTGKPGPLSASGTIQISVTAVNDAPMLTLPGTQSTPEDTEITLTGLLVTDIDAGGSDVRTTITATHGLFSNGSAAMEFTGSLDALNILLGTLTFTPDGNYNGPASVSILVDDIGDPAFGGAKTAEGTITIDVIAVNDAPTLTMPETLTTDEDTPLALTSISAADVDARDAVVQVTVSAVNGALNPAGEKSVVFTGTVAEVNAALDALTYTPVRDFNGTDALVVTVNDQGSTGTGGAQITSANTTITVTAINDAPTLAVPDVQTIDENQLLVFSTVRSTAIHAADPDSGADPIQVSLTAENGTLNLVNTANLLSVTGNGTSTLVFQGIVTDVNQALEGLTYQPTAHYNGSSKITVLVDDLGHNGDGLALSAVAEIAITINNINLPPVAIQPASIKVREDISAGSSVMELTASDPDAGENFTFTLVSGDGCDTAAPFQLEGSTLVTTVVLDYETTIGYTLCIQVADHEGETYTQAVPVSVLNVNEAPVNHLPSALATDEDTPLIVTGLSIDDVDAGESTMALLLQVEHGQLYLKNPVNVSVALDPENGRMMYIWGSQSDINDNLAFGGVEYTPDGNYNGPDTLTVTTSDEGASGLDGKKIIENTVAITVNPVNDAPANHLPTAKNGDEDTALTITGLSVTDVDASQNPLKVDLSVAHGTLALVDASSVTVASSGPGALTLTAGQDALNTAFAKGLVYTPTANYNGAETLTITTSDQGANGAGGAQSATDMLGFSVTPVKDAVNVTITGTAPQPSRANQRFTVSYRVTSLAGVPGGSVTVGVEGSGAACTGSLDTSGQGSCSLTLPQAGSYTLTATYGGDFNFLTGEGTPYTHQVLPNYVFLPLLGK